MKEYNKSAFVADVIKALEDAERASHQNPKDKATLARDAYSKLQFDYPLVSEQELLALTEAVGSKEPWAILTDRILTVLYDCVSRGSSKTGGTAPSTQQEPGPSASTTAEDLEADALLAAFQKLYALFILSTMNEALIQSTPEAASRVLGQFTNHDANNDSSFVAAGESQFSLNNFNISEPANDADERILDVTQDIDDIVLDNEDDDGIYEPLESPLQAPLVVSEAVASTMDSTASAALSDPLVEVISKLLYLSSRMSYHIVSSSSAWQDGSLLSSLETCLTALQRHPSFLDLFPAARAVCSLLHDRCVHSNNPVEFETLMKVLVNGLNLKDSNTEILNKNRSTEAAVLLGVQTAASLTGRLPQGPSRRKLWTQVDELWLQLVAGMLEQKEAQWRKNKKKEARTEAENNAAAAADDVQLIAISALITEFYILDAPLVVKIEKIQDVLLSTGLFRGLSLSFINYGRESSLESLRRTILICCASSTGLLTWARAVPRFSTVWEHPDFALGGKFERYGAVHAVIFGLPGGNEALAKILFLKDGVLLAAEDVPEVYITLQLLESMQKARDRSTGKGGKAAEVSFLSGTATVAALESLSNSLRALKVALDEADDDNRSHSAGDDDSEQAEKAREEAKLTLSTEEQAAKLAARRAKLLQPECLRMIKGLRAKPGSVGKGD